MPFFKSSEVKDQFYLVFLDEATQSPLYGMPQFFLTLSDIDGAETSALLRFFNRSGASKVEDFHEQYPCVVIQDFAPEIDRARLLPREFVEGAANTDTWEVQKVYLPLPFNFRFQVSAVADNSRDINIMFDWFARYFEVVQGNGFFTFKRELSPDFGEVGEIVPYTLNYSNLERGDGRYEYVFDFLLKANLHLKSAEWHTMVQDIEMGLHQKGDAFIETKIIQN